MVVGSQNNFSSFGGLVVGSLTRLAGSLPQSAGESGNTASGDFSSVSGGAVNTASGDVVLGQRGNRQHGQRWRLLGQRGIGTRPVGASSISGGHRTRPVVRSPQSVGDSRTRPAATSPRSVGDNRTRPAAINPQSAGAFSTRPAAPAPQSAGDGRTRPADFSPRSAGGSTGLHQERTTGRLAPSSPTTSPMCKKGSGTKTGTEHYEGRGRVYCYSAPPSPVAQRSILDARTAIRRPVKPWTMIVHRSRRAT